MTRRARGLEIVVAGAGPVGLLFAVRLARSEAGAGVRIRVVDRQEPVRWQAESTDPRVYALSRESQWLLGDLWPAIAARRVSPYGLMRVFEGDDPASAASIRFDAADVGEPDLGHIVEDNLLRTVLHEEIARLGVDADFGAGIERLERVDGSMLVTASDGRTTRVDLVVGADGVGSKVRAAAGIRLFDKRYGQRAVVTHVATELAHGGTAWQRFLPGGPLAFLPLADGRSSVVWSLPEARAERMLAEDDAAFLAALQTASAGVLGRLGACTPRLQFPLVMRHALRYVRPGVALIGDAAHAVHPLAGQGMNLGLSDAAALAGTLAAALAAGEHPGDTRVLRRYERVQKGHNLAMQLAFDGLNELFGPRLPGLAAPLRRLGMTAVDRVDPVKRLLVRRALGLDRTARPGAIR